MLVDQTGMQPDLVAVITTVVGYILGLITKKRKKRHNNG